MCEIDAYVTPREIDADWGSLQSRHFRNTAKFIHCGGSLVPFVYSYHRGSKFRSRTVRAVPAQGSVEKVLLERKAPFSPSAVRTLPRVAQ